MPNLRTRRLVFKRLNLQLPNQSDVELETTLVAHFRQKFGRCQAIGTSRTLLESRPT